MNADPEALRASGVRPQADALYHSSEVAHAARWALPLPSADATRADLAAQLARTLELLRQADGDDAALYFFRLALLHEDMHHEAALGMAQLRDDTKRVLETSFPKSTLIQTDGKSESKSWFKWK